jgi:hypothetical protein
VKFAVVAEEACVGEDEAREAHGKSISGGGGEQFYVRLLGSGVWGDCFSFAKIIHVRFSELPKETEIFLILVCFYFIFSPIST